MKFFTLIILLLTWALFSSAQTKVTGSVYSETDKGSLPSATIKIKETGATVITSHTGSFSFITALKTVTLEVSFVGYLTENISLALPTAAPINIYLKDDPRQLKEVVVSTGYQELPKERSTGSFSKINNELFNQQVSTSVLSRLENVANAVSVDRTSTNPGIAIRGLSTIQGISTPLIVLDNFPYEGDLNNINPNDVESITILKDAAAASIWGTKAGNGVIIITTKKGHYNQPLAIDFTSNLTTGSKPNLSDLKQMSPTDYVSVETMLFNNGYYDNAITDPSHPALSPVVEILLANRNGSISAAQANSQINQLQTHNINDDFQRYIYKHLFNQQYALSIRVGTEKMSWTASGGYDHNFGSLQDVYDKLNLHYQSNVRLTKDFELSSELYFTRSNSISGYPAYRDPSYANYPYTKLADNNGNPLAIPAYYSESYLSTLSNKLLDWNFYPLKNASQDINKVSLQDIIANLGLKYKINNGFNASFLYQYERQQTNNSDIHDQGSYFTRNLINEYTQIDGSGNLTYKVPLGGINDYSNGLLTSQNIRGQLSYNHDWGKNNLMAIAGGEIRNAVNNNSSNREYGVNADRLTIGSVDYTNPYPNFITGNYDYIPFIDGLSKLTNRFVSLFSNAAYTYDQRYTVSLSGRRDASNLFGVNTNNKWAPLWSAGTAWNISNESFYHFSEIPYLKLRATYGYSGNVNQSMSGVTILTFLANSVYTGTPYARFLKYANPDLQWEKVATLNLGVDFKTKNNRISGSIEYYRKNGSNLFGTALLDYTGGVGSSIVKNVAEMTGNGFDFELNSINTTGVIKWTTNFNLTSYHDKITSYYRSSLLGNNFVGTSSGNTISGLVGRPVYSILSYKFAGLDGQTGDPLGYLNGQISKDYATITGSGTLVSDLKYSGPAMPTWFGSIGNTVTWQNISLTARILYRFGYYFRKSSIDYNALYSAGIGNSDYSKRWQNPGDEKNTTVPSLIYPAIPERDAFYNGSEATVDKGDNIRLQYVTLGYDLTKGAFKPLPFNKLSVYLNLANLGIIWRANKDHIDPDYPVNTPSPVKTYSIGIRGNF